MKRGRISDTETETETGEAPAALHPAAVILPDRHALGAVDRHALGRSDARTSAAPAAFLPAALLSHNIELWNIETGNAPPVILPPVILPPVRPSDRQRNAAALLYFQRRRERPAPAFQLALLFCFGTWP